MQRGPYTFPEKSKGQTMFSPGKFGVGLPTVISEPRPTGFEITGNVAQKVPNDKAKKTVSLTQGATGSADPTAKTLGFGGSRRKGRKLSKKRRLTRLRGRQSRQRRR